VIKLVAPLGLERRESTRVTGSRDPLVAKTLHLIRERPVENLGVDALARMAGVSRRSLEMKFRKETGKTIHEAVVGRRMSEAKRLLTVGDISIAEVAERCRFSSVHYFSAAFKREVGETPGRYRRMQRERRENKR
jgi:LacI family transcriptional regulator